MTELDAWLLVMAAIRNSGWHSGEEFAKLPRSIQRIVGGPETLLEWSQLEPGEVSTVVASNFQRTFRARQKNEKEFGMLPSAIRPALAVTEEEPRRIEAPEDSEENFRPTPMPESFREIARRMNLIREEAKDV